MVEKRVFFVKSIYGGLVLVLVLISFVERKLWDLVMGFTRLKSSVWMPSG